MIIALDSDYFDLDKIHSLGVSYREDGFLQEKLIRDKRYGHERGISIFLFNAFNKWLPKEDVTILTWGGPEAIALNYRIEEFGYCKRIQVVDLERIIDSLFPCSSLYKTTKMLGTMFRKGTDCVGDAKAILAVYEKLVKITQDVKYAIDPTRVSDIRGITEETLLTMEKISLGALARYALENCCVNVFEGNTMEEKSLSYMKYRENLILQKPEVINSQKSELDFARKFFELRNEVPSRMRTLDEHTRREIPKQLEPKKDLHHLLVKSMEPRGKSGVREYKGMYRFKRYHNSTLNGLYP